MVPHSHLYIATEEEYCQPQAFKNNDLAFQSHDWLKNASLSK